MKRNFLIGLLMGLLASGAGCGDPLYEDVGPLFEEEPPIIETEEPGWIACCRDRRVSTCECVSVTGCEVRMRACGPNGACAVSGESCGGGTGSDAGQVADAGAGGLDAGVGGSTDAGSSDAGGGLDAGSSDAGGGPDAGDAGSSSDAGSVDAGSSTDAGSFDAGIPPQDAGVTVDAGAPLDAGIPSQDAGNPNPTEYEFCCDQGRVNTCACPASGCGNQPFRACRGDTCVAPTASCPP